MLQNAYLVVKIGVDTAENEPKKEWCVVADRPIAGQRDEMVTERWPRREARARSQGMSAAPEHRRPLHSLSDVDWPRHITLF